MLAECRYHDGRPYISKSETQFGTHAGILPIQYQHLLARLLKIDLTDFCRDRHIIENTESHCSITLSMMTWWSNNRNGIFDKPVSDSSRRLNRSTSRE